MEWKPISEAPMDGSKVDLWDRAGYRWVDCRWAVQNWLHGKPMSKPEWGNGTREGGPPPNPTHFLIVTPPPESNP